jgi:hypothetical protein
MRKAQKDPQGWLTNLTRTMMRQLHIAVTNIQGGITLGKIDGSYGIAILDQFRRMKMSPSTLGEIAFLLPQDMYQGNLPLWPSGDKLLPVIAKLSIVCRMYDLLCEEQARRAAVVETTNRSHLSAMGGE